MLRKVVNGGLVSVRNSSAFPKKAYEYLQQSSTIGSELSNGVRVGSVSNGRPTSTIGVYIDSGSRYETEGNNGVSALLERLIRKGTNKRSAKQLESELAKHGARLNTFTTRDHSIYLVQVLNENVEPTLEILADLLRNSKFNAGDVEAEKQTLLKQLNEVENNYEEVVWDMLHASAFQGTGMAMSPYGRTEDINNLTREDVINFADDHFKGHRVAIAAAGGVSHNQIHSFAEKNFGDLNNEYKRHVPPPEGVRFTGSEYHYRDDTLPVLYCSIAVEGVGIKSHDALPLKLAAQLVGQWDQSHLTSTNSPIKIVQLMSTLEGLHSYGAFSANYTDSGLFGFNFVHDSTDLVPVQTVINTVQHQWKHLATSVTDEDVDRAKNQLRTNLLGPLEDSANLTHWIATQALAKGKVTSVADLEKQIRHLDASSVREAVSRHVYDRELTIAAAGRTEALPSYVAIRHKQSWWRL
ncbi:Cytochrome b-c1 complex subunit 1, mitochondrial [Aphelenchoides besseyi]|nr:Cytochrome b-c1 complex subunit 1, mitochondrial [Aphelenchoides besseyi]